MVQRLFRGALLAAGLAVAATTGHAQDSAAAKDRRPTRLFRDSTPITFTLTADFKTIFKDRDTLSTKRFPATLVFRTEAGDTGTQIVELSTRGHSRLLPVVCDFPPIRVHFPPGDQRLPMFRGQGALKLSVNCRPKNKEYESFVLEEFLLYRFYNLFTDLSFKVRLAKATYVDVVRGDTVASGPSFFVEDASDMARRNGGELFEQAGVRFGDVDSVTILRATVYEYMIGNTDWALQLLHNFRIVRVEPGFYYPVPYDFDFSGIMKTPYAHPSQQLPIRSVRERLYRGPCPTMDDLAPIFAEFNARKDAIYAMYQTFPGVDPKRSAQALQYLDEFYKTINDPKKANTEFRYNCR
jgi:hypothetical protein